MKRLVVVLWYKQVIKKKMLAIYHQSIKIISRGKGQSGVAALAYRTGTELLDMRTGENYDYTKKSVLSVEFVLPEKVPEFFKQWSKDFSTDKARVMQEFSNYVESFEKRKDSQIYRESEFALQRDFSDEVNIGLARKFANDFFAAHGMVGVLSFHKEQEKKTGLDNLHCHALFLMRHIDENGLGDKNREWNSKAFLNMWREKWEEVVNDKFIELGIDKRVDHRSLEAQGLEIKPLPKLGMAAVSKIQKGTSSFRYKLFQDAQRHNLFLIQQRPERALEYITNSQSTFVRDDVIQLVGRYADSHEVFSNLVERIMASREILLIDGEGRDAVYTTRAQLKLEHGLVERIEAMSGRASHKVDEAFVVKALCRADEKLAKHNGLSQDQKKAVEYITSPGQLKVIVGYAGAGKTTALEAAKEAWQEQGYNVVGLAPIGRASKSLEGIGVISFTVDKFEKEVSGGRSLYNKNTVFVMDEAGMLDSRRMDFVSKTVDRLGAKLVLTGDKAQNPPIQSGPALRIIMEDVGTVKLETIVRQEQEWQKQATVLFGQEKTRDALNLYRQNNCIALIEEKLPNLTDAIKDAELIQLGSTAKRMAGSLWYYMIENLLAQGVEVETIKDVINKHRDYEIYEKWQKLRDESLACMKKRNLSINKESVNMRSATKGEMVKDWLTDRLKNPHDSHIMLANTNKDVQHLNSMAREELRKHGLISKEEILLKVKIEKDLGLDRKSIKYVKVGFSIGDQVIFKANDGGLKVSNGDLGTLLSIKGDKVRVQMAGDDKRILSFSNNLYPNIQHGWASTIISSQSCTYNHVKQLASFESYRNLSYVGATRHRQSFKMYASSVEFNNLDILVDALSRFREKLASTDYIKSAEEIEALVWQEKGFFDKAEKTYTRLKEGSQAVSHFVTGLFRKRKEHIKINTYGLNSEALRAIEKLGISYKDISPDVTRLISEEISSLKQLQSALQTDSADPRRLETLPKSDISSLKPDVPNKKFKHYDLDKINAHLESDGISLVNKLLGASPNAAMSNQKELRYGKKGSFVLTLQGPKAGKWHDFESGEGGNLFKLVAKELKLNEFKDQLAYVANFYGISGNKLADLDHIGSRSEKHSKQEVSLNEKELELKKTEYINKAYASSKPVHGTLAQQYLKDHRKIEGELPDALRFIANHGKDKLPALAAFTTDANGNRTGMQLIYLDPNTGKKANLDVNKRSHGKIGGSAVVIQKGTNKDTLFLAEGIETALSVASVAPKEAIVLAVLGVGNFQRVTVTKDQYVVICADNDSNKPPAKAQNKPGSTLAVEKAAKQFEEKGAKVTVLSPKTPGHDFNDVLQAEGAQGLKKYLSHELQTREIKQDHTSEVEKPGYKRESEEIIEQIISDKYPSIPKEDIQKNVLDNILSAKALKVIRNTPQDSSAGLPFSQSEVPAKDLTIEKNISSQKSLAEQAISALEDKMERVVQYGEAYLPPKEREIYNFYMSKIDRDEKLFDQVKEMSPRLSKEINKALGRDCERDFSR